MNIPYFLPYCELKTFTFFKESGYISIKKKTHKQ
jgi:hypothetical protein